MSQIQRIYQTVIEEHLQNYGDKIILLAGPRQVGKTTLGHICLNSDKYIKIYLNWDVFEDKNKITMGLNKIRNLIPNNIHDYGKHIVYYFDEIHKYDKWKGLLRGYQSRLNKSERIIITGSARMEVHKIGGESLKGLSFLYHVFPITVGEVVRNTPKSNDINYPLKINQEEWDSLLRFGGFPQPFLNSNTSFHNRWIRDKDHQLFEEDLRDILKAKEIDNINKLTTQIKARVKHQVNYTTLADNLNVKEQQVREWIAQLEWHYYCFSIPQWNKKSDISLKKNPKLYLWDWSELSDKGAVYENIVAVHLRKAIYFWNDNGEKYELFYLWNKKADREVDFLITRNNNPWLMVEVKSSENNIEPALEYYSKLIGNIPHVLQVTANMPYQDIDCFSLGKIARVPMTTFLSQLV